MPASAAATAVAAVAVTVTVTATATDEWLSSNRLFAHKSPGITDLMTIRQNP